jgi:hypothetical protein
VGLDIRKLTREKTMLNRDYDQHPDKGVTSGEVRECGPCDASDISDRLAKQYPAVSFDRPTPGISEGENQGQNAATTQQNGPLDPTYKTRPWGGDGHKKGNSASGNAAADDWRRRREGVNTGERSAIARAKVPKQA